MDMNSTQTLKCSTCSKTFTTKQSLKQHVFTHDPNATVKCEICGKITRHRPAWYVHMSRFHANKKQRPSCDICNRVFSSTQTLQVHIDAVHSTTERPGFSCGFLGCKKTYTSKQYLLKHIKIEHVENPVRPENVENPVRIPCTLCGKEFKTRAKFKQHLLTHKTKRAFKCAKCGRSFSRRAEVKRHQMVHLEKSTREVFQCQDCPRTFLTKQGLQYHIRVTHADKRSYPYAFCDKRFTASTSMRRHVDLKHSANKGKIYSCDKCEYKNRSEAELAAHHLARHNDADGHECHLCGKKFSYFRQLVNHCSRAHALEKLKS